MVVCDLLDMVVGVSGGRGTAVFAAVMVFGRRVAAQTPLVLVRQVVRRVQRADRRYNILESTTPDSSKDFASNLHQIIPK